jgi:hypothetical protein
MKSSVYEQVNFRSISFPKAEILFIERNYNPIRKKLKSCCVLDNITTVHLAHCHIGTRTDEPIGLISIYLCKKSAQAGVVFNFQFVQTEFIEPV